MDSLVNLCRCCLSPNSDVSLFDTEDNVMEKFQDITSIQVKRDDGMPQKLCNCCYSTMTSAYQFRTQCLRIDDELKSQLDMELNYDRNDKYPLKIINDEHKTLKRKRSETDFLDNDDDDIQKKLEKDQMKQLEALIKAEPNDGDDDYLYVLVIDDDKEKEDIKTEPKEKITVKKEIVQDKFGDSIDSFLVSERVPDNVPATILQDEDDDENGNNIEAPIKFDLLNESKRVIVNESFVNSISAEESNRQDCIDLMDQQNKIDIELAPVETITPTLSTLSNSNNSYIKILTTSEDGKIIFKGQDITYLANTQLGDSESGNIFDQEEVIVYEEGDLGEFQLLKGDDGDLVIEYADESQIATVLQQEDGSFLCECGEEFQDLDSYEKHQDTHNLDEPEEHLCNLCGKGFESAEILTGHTLLHKVSGVLIMCPFCNTPVKRNSLTQHIKYGHNNMKPKCKICMKIFANPNNLKRHMMIHDGIRQFECNICFRRFHQKITMQTHRLTHIDPFSCGQCDKTFQNKIELDAHKSNNSCSQSKVAYIKEEFMKTVKQHVTTQKGSLLGYACSICKTMFSLEIALEQHVEALHMVDPKELFCSECGEILLSKKHLQSHALTHKVTRNKNLKRFECDVCGKGCASQAMLTMHLRVHTNERPYPCHLCALKFKTKTHLRTHQLTHTREKKFGCSICMKFFALKGNLVVHLRTHTGERPYVCSICNEAFIDSKYLKKHKLKKHALESSMWPN